MHILIWLISSLASLLCSLFFIVVVLGWMVEFVRWMFSEPGE